MHAESLKYSATAWAMECMEAHPLASTVERAAPQYSTSRPSA